MNEMRPIRNNNGKLVCEIRFDKGVWDVAIKSHETMTILKLAFTGEVNLMNYTYMK